MKRICYHTTICLLLVCCYSCKRKLPEANAGKDRVIMDTTTCRLNATPPNKGQGKWYILKGSGGKIKNNKDPQTLFTGHMGEKYLLSWKVTVSYGYSNDLVYISFTHSEEALKPKAGKDTVIYDTNQLYLYANKPIAGAGQWNILSGNGGTIDSPAQHNSLFSGEMNETYTLEWSIKEADTTWRDQVIIEIKTGGHPSQASAGKDQYHYNLTTTTLEGNLPQNGVGQWEILSGSGGSLVNPSNHNTDFFGQLEESYQLEWRIFTSADTTRDTVTIHFESFQCGDTLKDHRDGQKYPTVLIGSQCWFAENLNTGEQINASMSQSNNDTIEKWCYNDMISNCDQNGGLYQWDEMMNYTTKESSQGICPKGWHVPSDGEYQTLEIYLGMSSENANKNNTWRGSPVGTALKTGGSSGYNALLSGGHLNNWSFFNKGSYEYPWTSTESGSNAFRRCIRSSSSGVGRYDSYPKSSGLSVRCIKNN